MFSVTIGQTFPDDRYITSQDCIVPRINNYAFDIIVTLNNLTYSEYIAIAEEQFNLYIFFYSSIPHIVMHFANGNIFDFALNMYLVRSIPLSVWFESDENVIGIYILEPITGIVKSIRYFKFENMPIFRNLLTYQFDVPSEEVPNLIRIGEQMFSPQAMISKAQYSEVIPRIIANL